MSRVVRTRWPGRLTLVAVACVASAGAAGVILALRRGTGVADAAPLALTAGAPWLAYWDLAEHRIRNRDVVLAAVAVVGVIATGAWLDSEPAVLMRAAAAAAAALIAGAVLSVTTGGFGGGDAKLMAVIALAMAPDGWQVPAVALLYGFLAAAATAIVLRLVSAARGRPGPAVLAMAPHLLVGAFVAAGTTP